MADFTTEQTLPFVYKVVDGRGRTVATDGDPVVASSDETVVTVAALTKGADNSWSGEAVSVTAGSARVTISADADLGEGVIEVIGVLECNVTLDPRTAARTVDVVAGTPVDKPV